MEKYFRDKKGDKLNVVEHTLDQLQLWPNLKIYIGTDSQDYGKSSRFVTCVVYRYGHRGSHFVYYGEQVPIIRDIYNRLYSEGCRTMDASSILTEEIPISIEALEFDYSNISKTKSTPLVSTFRSWTKGLNMNGSFKSGGQFATKAADHVCRHPNLYGWRIESRGAD